MEIKYFRPIGMDILIEQNENGTWGGSERTLEQMLSYTTYEALDKDKNIVPSPPSPKEDQKQ